MALSELERLLGVLEGRETDRPPVIAPGGMMSFLTARILEKHGLDGDSINSDAAVMTLAAGAAREETGFENFGVPFCLTCEAQAVGAGVSRGTLNVEPMITAAALEKTGNPAAIQIPVPAADMRMNAAIESVSALKDRHPDVPVIGNVTGPLTLSSSIIEFDDYARMLVRETDKARAVAEVALETIIRFAGAMLDAGADVIVVSDPTASGEIIGPQNFRTFLPAYRRIFGDIHTRGAKGLLHICGDVMPVIDLILDTGADGFSFDSVMSPAAVRGRLGGLPLMGNLSTRMLAEGAPAAVKKAVDRLIDDGLDIIAPSCGIDRGTPLENIRAMTAAVMERG